MSNGLGMRFDIKLGVINGNLPERKKLDVLVEARTLTSDYLDVNRIYDPGNIMYLLDAIYKGLTSFDEIRDYTPLELEKSSEKSAANLIEDIMRKAAEAEIQQKMKDAFAKLSSKKP